VFPSEQFGGEGQEFDTDAEILSYLVRAYNVNFPVMTKRDVNGPSARDVFLYLNAHLLGPFRPFTEWNFTKFLIDRNGKPFKRYETKDLPQSMEADIQQLLQPPEAVLIFPQLPLWIKPHVFCCFPLCYSRFVQILCSFFHVEHLHARCIVYLLSKPKDER
jgi:hypothetical protein